MTRKPKSKPRRSRPIRSPGEVSGIDRAILLAMADGAAGGVEGEVDKTVGEALRHMAEVQKEVVGDGPLMVYYRRVRDEAIKAIKALPDIKPTDMDSVVAVQAAIGDYVRLARFVAEAFLVTQHGREDDDPIEDEESLG